MPTPLARHVARSGPLALSGWLVIFSTALATPSSAADGRGISWKTDFAAAQAEAKARNLPLWIQFTGPWCIFCRKMDANAFVDPGIAARADERFVAVKVRSDTYENLVSQFGITSLPSTVVLSPSGRTILAQSRGYSDPYEFASILDGAWANALIDPGILAMSGYCPVRLVEGKGRVAGDPRLAVFHDGHAYRFADAEARKTFLADPEKYLPSAGGACVVSKKDRALDLPGDPSFGATYHGRLYLFSSLDARARFVSSPDAYSGLDIADNGLCPHCKTVAKAEVAGKPEFAATHSGKRYLFPDDAHRQAFRQAPDRYVR